MRLGITISCALAVPALGCAAGSQDSGAPQPVPHAQAGAGAGASAGTGVSGGAGTDDGASGMSGNAGGTASTTNLDAEAILGSGCAASTLRSSLLPANLLFVIDRTGTMACNPPPTTDSSTCEQVPERADPSIPSKWEITTAALIEAMKVLPASATVGISYFSNDDACGVHSNPSVPLAANTQAQQGVVEASLSAVTPGGGTPLVGATILAYQHMHDLALAGSITGNEFVVLISDGEQSEQCSNPPRCSDAESCYALLLDEEVPRAAAAGVGIRTFVIGAPGSEPSRSVLSTIADRGGTGVPGCDPALGNCHFDMTMEADFGAALSSALSSIVGQAITCELDIPRPQDGEAPDLDRVNVIFTPSGQPAVVVLQDGRAACDGGADGWQYTEDRTKIRLCGSICDTVRADDGGRVDVVLGCPIQGPD